MRKYKREIIFAAAASVLVLLMLHLCSTFIMTEPVTLNLALFTAIPEYESFEETVIECWSEEHPDVELNIVEWNFIDEELPDDIDVFVFDTMVFDKLADRGDLLPLQPDKIDDCDDLIPAYAEGCCKDGTIYAVPQFLCAEILYTRKSDTGLKAADNIPKLREALGEKSLLLDETPAVTKISFYMQALNDAEQRYIDHYPPIKEGAISGKASSSLAEIGSIRQKDQQEESDDYYYAHRFAEGEGRAYIGYAESMSVMGDSASDLDFRLFSMTGDENIPVLYVDAAAINSGISDQKKELAYDLLNMITGKDLLVKASQNEGRPRYLLMARYSVYDALASDFPIYIGLKEIAETPDAHVYRVKPDGAAYMIRAMENADILPDI